jgi:ABC-type branched-subunit amino acid transport system ATPase component
VTVADPILVMDKVRKVYRRGLLSRRETFSLSADLTFPHSRIVGVIGPNGAGKTTLFELITGNNAPSEGRVVVAGRNIHRVKVDERDRLAIHYHQSYQVRRFVTLMPSILLRSAASDTPVVHLFDEPQFNTQDGYIGFMLAFFRRLRAEGKLVFMSLHPTASYHLEILKEIAEEFLVVGGGRVERRDSLKSLAADPAVRAYLGPELSVRAEALA